MDLPNVTCVKAIGARNTTNGVQWRRLLSVAPLAMYAHFLLGDAPLPERLIPPLPSVRTITIDPAVIQKPWTGDLDGMIKRGFIRVLALNGRTTYFVDNGHLHGTVVDYARLFEDDLNKKLAADKNRKNKNVKLRVVFVAMRPDRIFSALMAGKGDIAAGNLTITPERRKLVDFAAAGRINVSEVVATGPASPKIASVNDLSGQEVFVRKSSSYFEWLTVLNEKFAAERRPLVRLRLAPETLTDEDLLEMLNAGFIQLVVVDRHIGDFWKQIFPNIIVHDDVAVHAGSALAWAIRKGSPGMKAALDSFVARYRGSSTSDAILARYLKGLKYVMPAVSGAELRKFDSLIRYFRKWGALYDVDWILMGAQAYQESQLNQNARSSVGAIGIMQVMPATGKEMHQGDISKTEANIAAGVKYVRIMIDRYFANEPMSKLDKVLFTFASYNAGPARIAELRKETAKRGLDPNVWFQNVEYVVGEKIGLETVTYVGNIYKYYLAYRLILERRAERRAAAEKIEKAARSCPGRRNRLAVTAMSFGQSRSECSGIRHQGH